MIWVAIVALVGVVALAVAGFLAVGRVRASFHALRQENAVLRARLDAHDQDIAQIRYRQNRAFGRLDKQNERIRSVRDDLTTRHDSMAKLVNENRGEVKKVRTRVSSHQERSVELGQRIASVRSEVNTRQDSQGRVNNELRTGLVEAKATSRAGRALATRLSGKEIHGSVRSLDDDALERLLEIAPTLGLDWISERQLRYMEHGVVSLEGRLRGRLAAPVEAMILRSMVVMAAPQKEVKVLEIGTLYGLSACYFQEIVAPQKASLHQTIIDPFMGYYEAGAPDLFTPIPITEEVATDNLHRVGATSDDYEMIVGLSEDDDVQARLADHRFDVVVIDGDHSYDGVRRDFENYAGHVIDGGFVIIDDYRGPSWPDVTRYVDETVFTDERFEVVTGELRTAVVRRVGS